MLDEMMRGMAASTGGVDSPKAMEEMSRVWGHMNELMEKDPKAYGEFLEQQQLENARTEAQAALNDQLGGKPGMFPEPGFVLKTITRSTRLTAAPPRKTFVNVVQHKHVLPPTLPSNEPVVDKDGKEHAFARTQAGSATVSMAVGHVRAMVDNSKSRAPPRSLAHGDWFDAMSGLLSIGLCAFSRSLFVQKGNPRSSLTFLLTRGPSSTPAATRPFARGLLSWWVRACSPSWTGQAQKTRQQASPPPWLRFAPCTKAGCQFQGLKRPRST
jgi:hypothetical protein